MKGKPMEHRICLTSAVRCNCATDGDDNQGSSAIK